MSAYWLLVPLLLPIVGGAVLGIVKPHSRKVNEKRKKQKYSD